MGPAPSKQPTIIPQNQNQVLREAGNFVQQFSLYNNQVQKRQQRHLLARIILYGHGHLITHLKKFDHEQRMQRRKILHLLKTLEYETSDLLYQDLVLKNIKNEKKRVHYQKFDTFIDKNQQSIKKQSKFQKTKVLGEEKLKQSKVAILLFVGGTSSRFKGKDNNTLPKQFYRQKEGQKCLLQIVFDKIQQKVQKNEKLILYLAYSKQNKEEIMQIIQKYDKLEFRMAIQNQIPIVNLSGKLCVKKQETFQIISFPRGCGDFENLIVKGKKILEDMHDLGVEYVCAFGVQNICLEVADPYQIGLLAENDDLSVAYKCTYPDNQNQNLKRIVYNSSKKCLEAIQLQTLLQNAQKSSHQSIHQSQVWINNTVFKLSKLTAYLSKKHENFRIQHVFRAKKIQISLWNPSSQKYEQMQHCFMFQRQLSDLLLNQELKSVGIMVERENQFAPVISINEQKTWGDAYSQYLYKLHNKKIETNQRSQNTVRLAE